MPGALAGADDILTTTPAIAPLLQASWVEPGKHVTAMSSDTEHKNELEPAVIARADRYVADRRAQCAALGELHHAIAAGAVAADLAVPELGKVIAGKAAGAGTSLDS